jgi:predicted RNase H-like HicB family nuclease
MLTSRARSATQVFTKNWLSTHTIDKDEAGVWVATSDDVPGLVAEAESLDALSEKLKVLVPELLDVNGVDQDQEASTE